jgi:hypothetical protein
MNVRAPVTKQTVTKKLVITLWMFTSLTAVFQVYVLNDSEKTIETFTHGNHFWSVICSKHDTKFVYKNLFILHASMNHTSII